VFLEWKPAGDDGDEASSASTQKDTDWTMVQSDSAAVSYNSEQKLAS